MDKNLYKKKLDAAALRLDKTQLQKKQLEVAVVDVLDSIALKLYKKAWANKIPDALTAPSRIFFSIWVNDNTLKQEKIMYNIHALKLRALEGYKITSIDFAQKFRTRFRQLKHQWPNVRTDYGPLTLMEGWMKINDATFEEDVQKLAERFLEMESLIDELLNEYHK